MAKRTAWTTHENTALVALYFLMFDRVTGGQPYNKAAMIRDAQAPTEPAGFKSYPYSSELRNRSRGSIECKLMNATAAHRDLLAAIPSIKQTTMDGHGYRALSNYQAALKDAMRDALMRRR